MFSRGPNDPIDGAPSVSSSPAHWISPEEYLEAERRAETRSEYFAGQVFALAGASREHNLIVTNLVTDLGTQLKGRPCEVYPSDMRLRIPATGLYTYPDVTVVCGTPQFEDHHTDTLLNPTVLIEVLSDSTERHDRARKTEHYRRIVSLVEYLLVDQKEPRIERYRRQAEREWMLTESIGLEPDVELASIGCVLPQRDIYDRVF
jgi:Uma2 family endonuclease